MVITNGGITAFVNYYDLPTFLMLSLLSVACVLLSGKKTYPEILEILQKVSIPNGALVTFISVVIVGIMVNDATSIGPNIAVCVLAIVYALIEYLVVFLLRQHVDERE